MATSLGQNFTCDGCIYEPKLGDKIKATIIALVALGIIIGNVFSAIVFNSRIGKKTFLKKVRLTMNSLICTDLSMGLFMCPFCIYSALYHCWPFGIVFCKIEALILAALFHESTLSLVLIALDRYFSVHHYLRYSSFMTSRKYIVAIIGTWVLVFGTYSVVIFAKEQFYFDEIGINCEPYYENKNVTITVVVLFYLVPVVLFIFSYGSIFFTANKRSRLRLCAGYNPSIVESRHNAVSQVFKTSKYLAAISIGFLVAVSPWNISTLVVAVTNVKLHEDLDFAVSWLAIGNSFWNVVIYSVLNRKFRRAAKALLSSQLQRFHWGTTSRTRLADFDLLEHCQRPRKRDSNPSIPDISMKMTVYSGSTFTLSSLESPQLSKTNRFSQKSYTVTTALP